MPCRDGALPRDHIALRLRYSRGGDGITALHFFIDAFCCRKRCDRGQYGVGEYFIGVVCASAGITLVGMLYPDDNSGVRRALDFCMSLCLLIAVVTPMGGMLRDAGEMINENVFDSVIPEADMPADEAVSALLAEGSQRMIEERLEAMICDSFALNAERVVVTAEVSVNDSGVLLDRVTVWLSGAALATDPREIKELIAQYTDAECEIVGGKP